MVRSLIPFSDVKFYDCSILQWLIKTFKECKVVPVGRIFCCDCVVQFILIILYPNERDFWYCILLRSVRSLSPSIILIPSQD